MKMRSWPPFLMAFAMLASASAPATAHDWFTDKVDARTGYSCCNNEDCHVIDEEFWWQEGKEYKVKWFDGQVYSIPANLAQPSQDKTGKAAACVYKGELRCFFIPAMF